MPVTVQTPVNAYTGNGLTTTFAFAFLLLDADDLVVELLNAAGVVTAQTLGVDYTISGIGNPAGGSVTFTTAPASGVRVTISRQSALERQTDYQSNGDLLSDVLDGDFDRLWLVVQELRRDLRRALKVPADASADQSVTQSAAQRAGKILTFDGSGNVSAVTAWQPGTVAVSAFAETLLDDVSASEARDTLGVQRTAFGANLANAANAAAARTLLDVSQSTLTPTFTSLNGGPLGGLRNFVMNPLWAFTERAGFANPVLQNSTNDTYFFDGWRGRCQSTATAQVNRQASGGPNDALSRFYARVLVQTADTSVPSTAFFALEHRFHPVLSPARLLSLGPVTLSFWVWSSVAGTYGVYFASPFAANSLVTTYTINQASTWELKTITLANGLPLSICDDSGGYPMRMGFTLMAGTLYRTGTLNQAVAGDLRAPMSQANAVDTINNQFRLGPIQLEPGSVATEFERAPGAHMLDWVSKRAQRLRNRSDSGSWPVAIGRATSTTNVRYFVPFPRGEILAGEVDLTATFDGSFTANGNSITANTLAGRSSAGMSFDGTTSGLTAGQAVEVLGSLASSIVFAVDI